MTQATIYHNPRCSKSRETHRLITERLGDHNITVVNYLDTPPSAQALQTLVQQLGLDSAKSLIRFKDDLARSLNINKQDERPESQWIELLANHPKLLERPIVVVNQQAKLGRPPEKVLDLLTNL